MAKFGIFSWFGFVMPLSKRLTNWRSLNVSRVEKLASCSKT